MNLANITVNQIIIILILVGIGALCYKFKLIDAEINKRLSEILLMLVNPVVILVAYQRTFSKSLLEGLLISILLSAAAHILSILISYTLIRRKQRRRGAVTENRDVDEERCTCIYGNVGFMGIPLAKGIFGNEGVFYATGAITVFNIFLWTHGIMTMRGDRKLQIKNLLKTFKSPTIIAVIVGFTLFVMQIKIPSGIFKALDHIADLNTPFAMLVAGATIANANLLKTISKGKIYFIAVIKLILIPVVMIILFHWFPIPETVFLLAVIMAALPTGATNILFSVRYNRNSALVVEIFTITTLLSTISIPLIVALAEFLM